MAKSKQTQSETDLEEQKIDEIPTEEDIKSAKTPDDKLEMMKKLLNSIYHLRIVFCFQILLMLK